MHSIEDTFHRLLPRSGGRRARSTELPRPSVPPCTTPGASGNGELGVNLDESVPEAGESGRGVTETDARATLVSPVTGNNLSGDVVVTCGAPPSARREFPHVAFGGAGLLHSRGSGATRQIGGSSGEHGHGRGDGRHDMRGPLRVVLDIRRNGRVEFGVKLDRTLGRLIRRGVAADIRGLVRAFDALQ